jgi:hypothetical protein
MAINQLVAIPAGATAVSTEQTAAQTPGLSVGAGIPVGVILWGLISVTLGAGATGFQLRCRENTTGLGNQIDQTINYPNLVAGNTYDVMFAFSDNSPSFDESGAAQYNLTVQQTGAPSAAGSVNSGKVIVEV